MKIYPLIFMLLLAVSTASAATLEICNGGLLGLESSYTANFTDLEIHYGDTVFVRVADGTGYAILVDGVNRGEDKIFFHVDKTGTITIETSPSTQTVTLNVTDYGGYLNYLAGYFLFVKQSCPPLLNNIFIDTVLWSFMLVPILVVIGLKIALGIIRLIL